MKLASWFSRIQAVRMPSWPAHIWLLKIKNLEKLYLDEWWWVGRIHSCTANLLVTTPRKINLIWQDVAANNILYTTPCHYTSSLTFWRLNQVSKGRLWKCCIIAVEGQEIREDGVSGREYIYDDIQVLRHPRNYTPSHHLDWAAWNEGACLWPDTPMGSTLPP